MKVNNIILVPTDFSEVCYNAIEHAVRIAELINFKVSVYHVINKDTFSIFKGVDDIEGAVEEKLIEITKDFTSSHSNVAIDYYYEEGSIFDLIHKKAEMIGANIILLGTHGKKGMQYLMGSYALKVIKEAKMPTLVVQKKKFTGYNDILLPVYSFTEARQKVTAAIAVAKKFNSTIHIFKELVKDAAEESRINIITKHISEAFDKENVSYSVATALKSGDSSKVTLDYAVENNLDLIMILTEPEIGTTYFNLGPWNEKIMFNDAQIPVMCINPLEHSKIFFDL